MQQKQIEQIKLTHCVTHIVFNYSLYGKPVKEWTLSFCVKHDSVFTF